MKPGFFAGNTRCSIKELFGNVCIWETFSYSEIIIDELCALIAFEQ